MSAISQLECYCIEALNLFSIVAFSISNKRYWYKDGPGAKRTMLPKQYMQAFANKQITCVEYDCLTDDQEREIFQRVQLGVALTPAERMQAITGPRASVIREVQSKVIGEEGFGDNLDWGRARGRDFQCLASIVYLIENHPQSLQQKSWTRSRSSSLSYAINDTMWLCRSLHEYPRLNSL